MPHNKYTRFKRIETVAEKNSALGNLLNRANNIMAQEQAVRAILEPSCRPHCWLANYRSGILYLQTDSAAWGARLRMQQRTIIQQLKSARGFSNLHSVKVLIQPRYSVAAVQRNASKISTDNIQQLEEIANEANDKALKTALMNLAHTGRKKHQNNGG
jgi:hypothetical protein